MSLVALPLSRRPDLFDYSMKLTNVVLFLVSLLSFTRALPLKLEQPRDLDEHGLVLTARQLLGVVGGALRTAGSAAGKVPGKAGNRMAKEQAGNVGSTNGVDVKKTAERMGKNMAAMGQPQNMKCLEGMVDHMAKYGGANGNWPCNKKDPKEEAKGKQLEEAKKKAFASSTKVDKNSIGAKSSAAREKVFGGKK